MSVLSSRTLEAWRRISGTPNWALVSGALVLVAALLEARLRASTAHDPGLFPDVDTAWNDGASVSLVVAIAFAARNRFLVPALAAATLVTAMAITGSVPWTIVAIGTELALIHLAGVRCPRWVWLAACALLFAAALSGDQGPYSAPTAPLVVILAVGVAIVGDTRRARGDAIAERDEARRETAETLQDRAIMEERARIARELHDVVAHEVSMIAVQAETARLTTPGMPEEGKEHLRAIGETSRNALTELRRVLGLLRADDDEAERAPQPGLAMLPELLDAARSTGSHVRLVLEGGVVPLPPGLDLTAYRVLQEALTNTRRHAPGADVEVELRYAGETLTLRVRDHGPGPGAGTANGHGLVGMRERVDMVDGTLESGAAPGGGFVVEASLPLEGAPPSTPVPGTQPPGGGTPWA